MTYTPTIGLEIHAELKTKSKMFCDSPNDPAETRPNVNICEVCMGHPGTLPAPNREAIRKVIKVGLALQCQIASYSKFDRKNYFYPDLPKGYQISQYDLPFCREGELEIEGRHIRITRVHLEEDTGKLVHPEGADCSLIDFNRAGVPLLELVTEPDIASGKEAVAFAKQLRLILRYLGASSADMERGQMRVEANVSVRPEGQEKLGTKVEVKNLNSFRAVEQAIAFETERQTALLEKGKRVVQETRGWNESRGETFSQREKEEAQDYRYFPEPDIPPLTFAQEEIEALRQELPELPQERKGRFKKEYGLGDKEADMFVAEKDLAEFFEQVISELGGKNARLAANYMLSDLKGLLAGKSIDDKGFKVNPENFAELIELIASKKISSAAAKQALKEMAATGADPDAIIAKKGLAQVSDETELHKLAEQIIEANSRAVEDYKKGKETALQFLVGQMMKASRGSASPEIAAGILQRLLKLHKLTPPQTI